MWGQLVSPKLRVFPAKNEENVQAMAASHVDDLHIIAGREFERCESACRLPICIRPAEPPIHMGGQGVGRRGIPADRVARKGYFFAGARAGGPDGPITSRARGAPSTRKGREPFWAPGPRNGFCQRLRSLPDLKKEIIKLSGSLEFISKKRYHYNKSTPISPLGPRRHLRQQNVYGAKPYACGCEL
jgi:hypothetical protein